MENVAGNDCFEIFGLNRSFYINLDELNVRYFDLQQHKRDPSASGPEISQINVAYKILKSPLLRAECVLGLLGYSSSEFQDGCVFELFELNEHLCNICDPEELELEVSKIKTQISSLNKGLELYSVNEVDRSVAAEIFAKISKIRFMQKIIDRVENAWN